MLDSPVSTGCPSKRITPTMILIHRGYCPIPLCAIFVWRWETRRQQCSYSAISHSTPCRSPNFLHRRLRYPKQHPPGFLNPVLPPAAVIGRGLYVILLLCTTRFVGEGLDFLEALLTSPNFLPNLRNLTIHRCLPDREAYDHLVSALARRAACPPRKFNPSSYFVGRMARTIQSMPTFLWRCGRLSQMACASFIGMEDRNLISNHSVSVPVDL
ncbi:hypothetical protein B0H11DRAFT_244761 [Mycena galericulata]|nr:hypothetical protein B0H11DRAFT_244761 [Mycena galericulata]